MKHKSDQDNIWNKNTVELRNKIANENILLSKMAKLQP